MLISSQKEILFFNKMPKIKIHVRTHIRKTTNGKSIVRKHHRNIKIPPGWKKVKFYRDRNYIATGIDRKGRLQYIYHKNIRRRNEDKKFRRIDRLTRKKKVILNRVIKDVKDGNTEAQAVYTIFKTGFRPGSEKDTKADKEAFGAITLLKEHIKLKPRNMVKFNFIGKKGILIKKEVQDPLLADIMKERKQDKHLFDTSPGEVREYFDKKTNGQFQLKDLRTLKGFEVADQVLAKTKSEDPKEIKKEVVQEVSKELGNTESVAAKSYIAPKLEGLKDDAKKMD